MLACTALCASGTALSRAPISPVFAQPPVYAELIAPTSYEQYLALLDPKDVAATNGYLAIADGNKLYVFDEEACLYREYTHAALIQKIDFDGEGNLYFLSELELYKLTPDALKKGEEATSLNVACKGLFAIEGDLLCYYTSLGALKFYSLSQGKEIKELPTLTSLQSESPLSFGKDALYCVMESPTQKDAYTVYAINLQTYAFTPITEVSEKLLSMTVANHLLAFITEKGDFASYNVTNLSAGNNTNDVPPLTADAENYVSLCSYDDSIYAVRGNIVRHYSVEDVQFTDYEIGASSASSYRLNGATSLTLNGDQLFIADDGNRRVSVYDTQTNTFEQAIETEFDAPYLASYQNTLLVASEGETAVYSLAKRTYGTPLLSVADEEIEGKIVGVASVYGRYYVLTEDNYLYTLSKESGDWAWEETHKNTQSLRAVSAVSFTADVYGSLYVAYDDDTVYRFTEKELLNPESRGQKILEKLRFPEKISVDYETDLYALVDGKILEYSQSEGGMYTLRATYDPDYGLVKDEEPHAISFAFGLENEFAYVLYEGDYIVKTDELHIPAVNPIPVGDAAELVFGESKADYAAVTVGIDAILIEFDLERLNESTEFPYVAFERTQSEQIALKIGEEGEYSLLAIAKQRTGEFATCLVLTESCTELTTDSYRLDYEESCNGYLTNDVSLYKFPYLNEVLSLGEVKSGTEVKLLGEVSQLDHAYYQVELTDENGNVKTGFIPKPYVTSFDGSTPTPETVVIGGTDVNDDGVWRSAYIILGFGAIVILVDFLILHRKREEE